VRKLTRDELIAAAINGAVTSTAEFSEYLGIPGRSLRRYIKDTGAKAVLQEIYRDNRAVAGEHSAAESPEAPTATVVGAGPEISVPIEEIKHTTIQRYKSKSSRREQKNNQTISFERGPIALFFVGDQHFGNAGTDVERAYAEQEIIMDTPGAIVWQMGDPVDNFIIGRLMVENMKPSLPVFEQWALAKDYLEGFEDKMVAVVGGNHDAWTLKVSGIDYRREICPDHALYDGDEIKASVWVGDHEFRVWSRHQWSGHSKYNPTHGQENAARFDDPNFDIYVGAHTHRGSMFREFIHKGERKAAIQTGTYKVEDDYALERGFSRNDASTACALILHEDGSFFGCADIRAASQYMKAVYQPVGAY
jgi:hypothetical protein